MLSENVADAKPGRGMDESSTFRTDASSTVGRRLQSGAGSRRAFGLSCRLGRQAAAPVAVQQTTESFVDDHVAAASRGFSIDQLVAESLLGPFGVKLSAVFARPVLSE